MALKCTRSHAPPGAQVGGGACGAAWLLKFSSEYASDDKPNTPSASEQQSAKSSSYSYCIQSQQEQDARQKCRGVVAP